MAATLKDIAEELGISQMTVSRALRGMSRSSIETRRRVREVAARLGYRPIEGIIAAPTVRTGKGDHTLRLLLPTVGRRLGAEGGSWWLDRMIQAMEERLALSNGRLVEQHFRNLDELIEEHRRGRFHGIVLRQPFPHVWVEKLLKLAPLVYAVEFAHQTGVDSVFSNEHHSAGMVLDYLSQRGHSQIAWLGILDRDAPYSVVFDALDESSVIDRQAFSVHGARYAAWANIAYCQLSGQKQPLVLVERDWKRQTLEDAVGEGLDRILATRPAVTAVVCSADSVAAAFLATAKARGLCVPEDLSIVSYGASQEVTMAEPSITSVEMPMELIGRVVPELIERRLADPAAVPISLQFQTTLFEGKSVATLPRETARSDAANPPSSPMPPGA